MKVRGITILSRKILVTRQFGAEAWARFYDDMARAHRCYRALVTPDSLIPLPSFLAFHDELMRRFFKTDPAAHFDLGRRVSRWALSEGPFRSVKDKPRLAELVAALPVFHRTYFEESATRSEAEIVDEGVEFRVFDLPQSHPYFEPYIVGYITEVLEMFCANPIRATRLRGGSGREYVYLLAGSPANDQASADAGASDGSAADNRWALPVDVRQLSDRELEVLTLIAHGKTNDEIGAALGISGKTAQHHVARAYRKIGVSGRVAATVWLAQRGLIGR